jgi:transcriptional regulator with XRE-family HTH domain
MNTAKLSIREIRLMKAMTVRDAALASGIPSPTIRRWEQGGVGKACAFRVSTLLWACGSSMDFAQFHTVPTNEQIIEAILSGSSSINAEGKVTIELATVTSLLKSEGFEVSELEDLISA